MVGLCEVDSVVGVIMPGASVTVAAAIVDRVERLTRQRPKFLLVQLGTFGERC